MCLGKVMTESGKNENSVKIRNGQSMVLEEVGTKRISPG